MIVTWSRLPIANATFGVCVSVTESVVSVAVYVTVSAVVFVTVKVTTPAASDGPLAAEIDEEPVWASETVLPARGFPKASVSVTVIVEVVLPSAGTELGLAATVDTEALTAAALTVMPALVPLIDPVTVSVAVSVREPAVFSVAEKAWVPLSAPVKV